MCAARFRALLVSCALACAMCIALSPRAATYAATLAQPQSATCAARYVVQSGDWLARIATRAGLAWPALYAANRGVIGPDPARISPGMVLCLVGAAASPPPTVPPTTPPPTGGTTFAQEFCQSAAYWPSGAVVAWQVPVGCYAGVYVPNPNHYVYRAGFGWCNWWAEVLHPSWDIWTLPRHSAPRLGAAIYFAPGVQGASSVGHWGGEVIALRAGWALISEMNDTWRGAGFGRVNYRYIALTAGVAFVYPN